MLPVASTRITVRLMVIRTTPPGEWNQQGCNCKLGRGGEGRGGEGRGGEGRGGEGRGGEGRGGEGKDT